MARRRNQALCAGETSVLVTYKELAVFLEDGSKASAQHANQLAEMLEAAIEANHQ